MQEQLTKDKYTKIQSCTKRIDFTSKLLATDLNLFNLLDIGHEENDVLWWGLCLITFNELFTDEIREEFNLLLKKNFIQCTIIDNHSDKEFLMSFDLLDDNSIVNRGLLLRKGIHPCVHSIAESRDDINWYHLASMTDKNRNELACMYKRIYGLFYDKIISIEIVRDLYAKEYLLI
jgi:hypothetical protein